MVFYEAAGKKELKWELSSDIGKYDNMYKLSFKTINDQGAENGMFINTETLPILSKSNAFQKDIK